MSHFLIFHNKVISVETDKTAEDAPRATEAMK